MENEIVKKKKEKNENKEKKRFDSTNDIAKDNIWESGTQIFQYRVLGYLSSVFKEKNGTPRQGILCKKTRAKLKLSNLNNPEHALEGLEEFSHVFLIFHFHDNGNDNKPIKLKVTPPRTDNKKTRVGVFSTRSPHRPNAIGLSVARIDKIEGDTLHLSGIDLIHNTPILDIKPYIPEYDSIQEGSLSVAHWISNPVRSNLSGISWEPAAQEQLRNLVPVLEFYDNFSDIQEAIEEVLHLDPRSIYRKSKKLVDWGFCIDVLNVLCQFDPQENKVVVVGFEDWTDLWNPKAKKIKQKALEKEKKKKEKFEKKNQLNQKNEKNDKNEK